MDMIIPQKEFDAYPYMEDVKVGQHKIGHFYRSNSPENVDLIFFYWGPNRLKGSWEAHNVRTY